MRVTDNPDFFCPSLSKQTALHVLKDATNDFDNWLKALKSYKKYPSKFLGRPKMPGYIKSDIRTTCLTHRTGQKRRYGNPSRKKTRKEISSSNFLISKNRRNKKRDCTCAVSFFLSCFSHLRFATLWSQSLAAEAASFRFSSLISA